MLNNVSTMLYIIIGEYQGLTESCEVFTTEEEQIKAFEKRTGYTWQQYKDGDYNFDDVEEGTFYRCFETTVSEGQTGGTKVTLQVDIECYSRSLHVVVDRPHADQAAAILDNAYDTWVEGTQADVEDSCCEEYILEQLKAAGLPFTYRLDKPEDKA